MAETKIYLPDDLDKRLREYAMKRFGYGKGSISKAAEEAISRWVSKISSIERHIALAVEKAKADNSIIAILLFGSYLRKNPNFRDVDIAILADKRVKDFAALTLKYRNIVGIDSPIDISVLNDMPLSTQSGILKESALLYCRDSKLLHDYTANLIEKWEDFKYAYNVALG